MYIHVYKNRKSKYVYECAWYNEYIGKSVITLVHRHVVKEENMISQNLICAYGLISWIQK